MTATIDHKSGAVTDASGRHIGTVRFNGNSGSYGRRWQVTRADRTYVGQAATRQEGAAMLEEQGA